MAGKSKAVETAAETRQTEVITSQDKPMEEAKEPKRYMYVGPTIPGIGIQNRVYTDIPPEVVDFMKDGHQIIGDLFIQIRDYPTANRMIREKKGYLYNAYLAAEKIKIENVKKAENTFSGGKESEERG